MLVVTGELFLPFFVAILEALIYKLSSEISYYKSIKIILYGTSFNKVIYDYCDAIGNIYFARVDLWSVCLVYRVVLW